MRNESIHVHNTCDGEAIAIQLDDDKTHLLSLGAASKLRSDIAYALYLRHQALQPFSGKGHVLGYSVKDRALRGILDAAKGVAG